MQADSLFYIVFLGQIFLISYYFPKQILARMRYVVATYPPEQYPKLYPKSLDYYQLGHTVFERIYQAIVVVGLVIYFSVMFVVDHATFADDGYISEFWPMLYGVIQFTPMILLELSEFSQLKLMRKANTATTRKADLRPRRLFEYVPPGLFAAAVGMIGLAIVLDLYFHDFQVSWGRDTIQRAIVLIVTNLFVAGVGGWTLYGRNLNPHQAYGDRTRQIRIQLRSLCFSSMALSVFFIIQAADDVYDMDFLDAALMSLFFQVIAYLSLGPMLRGLRIEDIDFDVYRNDSAVT